MRAKLVLLEKAHFDEHPNWVEEEDEEIMEDKLDEESPLEVAFERGVDQANNEMIDSWAEDEFE